MYTVYVVFIIHVVVLFFAKTKNKLDSFLFSFFYMVALLISILVVLNTYITGYRVITISAIETIKNDIFSDTDLFFNLLLSHVFIVSLFIIAILFVFFSSYIIFKYISSFSYKKIPVWLCYVIFISLISLNPFWKNVVVTCSYLSALNKKPDYNSDFYDNYKKPIYTKNDAIKSKNIVFLYLESFERTFFNKESFENIAENTNLVSKENLTFTNVNQVNNTGFTIAGMVASQCGIPFAKLFSDSHMSLKDFNQQGEKTLYFLPKAICLTDILYDLGYNSYFSKAASLKFSGAGKFYAQHHTKSMRDSEYFSKKYNNPPQNAWGVYDDIVLNDMFSQYIELSEKKEKFMLMGITVDTHFPNGFLSDNCPYSLYDDKLDSMSNAIKCSDYQVFDFINKIKSSKFYKDTIIVIASDHLMMKNPLTEKLKNLDRKDQFTIINPDRVNILSIDKSGSTLDVGVTLLDEIGFNITRLGLGRSLLRNEDTMVEKYNGVDGFNKKINEWLPELAHFWRK